MIYGPSPALKSSVEAPLSVATARVSLSLGSRGLLTVIRPLTQIESKLLGAHDG